MGLTNSQYNQIMNLYDNRRFRSNRERTRRIEEVHQRIPAYKALSEAAADLQAKLIGARLAGNERDAAAIEDDINQNIRQRSALLAEGGFPADYLEARYECPDCRDTGYIGSKKCHCFVQAAIDLLYTQSGMLDILKKENFEAFRLDYYPDDITDRATGLSARENAKTAREYALDFTARFADGHRGENIYLYGPAGTGKTFLTHCIAKALIDQGMSVIYLSSVRLFEIMADHHFHRSDDQKEHYVTDDFLEHDLLIIDDLGTESINSFTISALFELINERALSGRSIIISTNLDPAHIRETYADRIFSRIMSNYKLIKLYGADIRIHSKI